jgi:cyclopropane-fatty-acyl-phospholipid synthase
MSYSSAIFGNETEALSSAQLNKYDRILSRLHNNDNLLEVGCGWGGFMDRAIQLGGNNVKGVTISDEQFYFAKDRLKDRGNVELIDYRKLEGKHNNLVSIEMFEAVGEKYWRTYFDKIASLLDKKGKAIIQTITIDNKHFEAYRKGGDAIRTFIFPGGMLPSPEVFKDNAAKSGLKTTDEFAFGKDYATTLKRWLINFESKLPEIRSLGFDEKFIRLWKYYLASCAGSFQAGRTDVMQMELQHA